MGNVRVSMDIGGTFTDVIAYDETTSAYRAGKSSTTPHDLTEGVICALTSVVAPEDISFLVHGTTQGLNAFLTRRGTRALLLATDGASQQLHIARGPRWKLYDLHYRKPTPLVPLADIVPIAGRFSSEGERITPLDEDAVRQAARRAKNEGITSIAVGYLYSFAFPEHELRTREILRDELGPDVTISLSHEAAREWREYERTSSATIEAYTGPVIRTYLNRLEADLTERRVPVPLHVMQSSGGILSVEAARRRPLQTLLSGPVGGAMGGAALSELLERANLICVDMGGTSFDVSLIIDGVPDSTPETSLEGLPILMPVVNIHTVGAGGGSIAWLEHGGLRVGPQSAGASPGPACYRRGGVEPTVTDANLVLGRVDPDWFAGGTVQLDPDAAEAAVAELAQRLGLSTQAMAEGICDVANAKMAQAIRTITVGRGIEPREFTLVAFGGAGPMHAAFLAQELGIREVIIPRFPGAFSAWGMLQTSIRTDQSEAYFVRDDDLDAEDLAARLQRMSAAVTSFLEDEHVPADAHALTHAVDVRYVAQEYTLTVPILGIDEPRNRDFLDALAGRFADQHRQRFGHANLGAPIELVTVRVTGHGDLGRAAAGRTPDVEEAPSTTRPCVFERRQVPTQVVRRSALASDTSVPVPAIILEETATTVVPPGFTCTIDQFGNIVLRQEDQS